MGKLRKSAYRRGLLKVAFFVLLGKYFLFNSFIDLAKRNSFFI